MRFLDRAVIAGVQIKYELSFKLTDRFVYILSKTRIDGFAGMGRTVCGNYRFVLYNAKQPAGGHAIGSPHTLIVILAIVIR
ncbi:hypothetical protein D3C76_1794290 [compost metagenome]